ncbi:MAG: hypothetical protein Q7K42_01280, partial [Candidatus Diapherotrites archaeon]|nr:hypothetical protein [Candidatus Diapherotrites archaeon]
GEAPDVSALKKTTKDLENKLMRKLEDALKAKKIDLDAAKMTELKDKVHDIVKKGVKQAKEIKSVTVDKLSARTLVTQDKAKQFLVSEASIEEISDDVFRSKDVKQFFRPADVTKTTDEFRQLQKQATKKLMEDSLDQSAKAEIKTVKSFGTSAGRRLWGAAKGLGKGIVIGAAANAAGIAAWNAAIRNAQASATVPPEIDIITSTIETSTNPADPTNPQTTTSESSIRKFVIYKLEYTKDSTGKNYPITVQAVPDDKLSEISNPQWLDCQENPDAEELNWFGVQPNNTAGKTTT